MRLKYHYEPLKGFINDPNGLCFFKGQYHLFNQHNPYKNEWGLMHWSHATSLDLMSFKTQKIALFPDKPYDCDGCYSGCAIVKDEELFLFYTSVKGDCQTISLAMSKDGFLFTKWDGNPLIDLKRTDFRDPKVFWFKDAYYMVVGGGYEKKGEILLFRSLNLYNWEYVSVLFRSDEYGEALECPDLFFLDGKWVLMFSTIKGREVLFFVGDFDGISFSGQKQKLDYGPDFYAAQTFFHDGRRILMAWMYQWGRKPRYKNRAGLLTIPRELRIVNGRLLNIPIKECNKYLKNNDDNVIIKEKGISIAGDEYPFRVSKCEILRDGYTLEVFINDGEVSFSYLLGE